MLSEVNFLAVAAAAVATKVLGEIGAILGAWR